MSSIITDNGMEPNSLSEINDADGDGFSAVNYDPTANIDDGSGYPDFGLYKCYSFKLQYIGQYK